MPDAIATDSPPELQLADSDAIAKSAIAQLVAGPFPSKIAIDGRVIEVEATIAGPRAQLSLRWPRGAMRLRVGLVTSSSERRNAEDHGHRQSLQVWSEDGGREVGWNGFEWFVRDAIREHRDDVKVRFWNSFFERGAAEEETGIGNAELGRRSRELCAGAGVGGGTNIVVGTYDLRARSWKPDATIVLERVLVLTVVKTVLRDRGRGLLLQGDPPFAVRSSTAKPVAPPSPPVAPHEKLIGLSLWFGPGAEQVGGVREALRFIHEEGPTTDELEGWMREKGGLTHTRLDVYTRPLLQLELAQRDDDDRWSVTELGAELVESSTADRLYQAFVAHYVGFDETLAYYGRGGSGLGELLEDLNRRLGTTWTSTAQPSRRAYWLRAMGLLDGERGEWSLSPAGRALFERMPASLRTALPPTADRPAEGIEDAPTPTRAGTLAAADVELDGLELDPELIAKCIAALQAGKHLLLIGAPGTGKTAIAKTLAAHAAERWDLSEAVHATASADWTAYDTIGGWTQRADKTLAFRAGVITRAIRQNSWLVLDELNRADADKCLGEAYTVLAGGKAETAFTEEDGKPVVIGRGGTYDPGEWFRVIATMNVRDKATLFRLSYALLRRFAVIEVPVPSDVAFGKIAHAEASALALDPEVGRQVAAVFMRDACLGEVVPPGAAMLRDSLKYVKHRGASPAAIAESVELFVLPQLDGLDQSHAQRARRRLRTLFAGDAPAQAAPVRAFDGYFPHVTFHE